MATKGGRKSGKSGVTRKGQVKAVKKAAKKALRKASSNKEKPVKTNSTGAKADSSGTR